MERIAFAVLIVTSACGSSARHVFVPKRTSWAEAQQYCRDHYTDLSPITNEVEETAFKDSVGEDESGWIGLYWESTNQTWSWAGGTNISNGVPVMTVAIYQFRGRWFWRDGRHPSSFFCLNLMVVQEEKTWEEAQQHCRQNHANLTSLLSQTQNLLARTEIQQGDVTQQVWVGLRLLEDRWLWVDGSPLEYRAWNQAGGQEGQCPVWRRCGALSKEGAWEDRDCRERLSFICG